MNRYDSYEDSGVKWLGEIPSHWEVLAIKHILKLKKEIVGKRSSQYDLLSLTLKGVVKRDMENPEGKFPASFDTYQLVEPNDFVFCNFDNEETPRAVGLSPYKGMITGAYDVLSRKNANMSDKYLIYYFLYIDDAKRFKPLYKGLRKTVPFDSFMSYKIPVPSIREQDAIVAYLDAVTSKIDTAITQQQKMIDLLNERKQIIINNAVTKGLDPNVKMKPSGVDWIGDIPEHWEIKRGKYLFCIINELSTTGKEELLTVSDKTGITPRSAKNVNMFMSESLIGHKKCHVGDICSNIMWMWHGAVGVTKYDGVISPSYAVYRQQDEYFIDEYLDLLLRLPKLVKLYTSLSTGLTESRLRLYPTDFLNIFFFLPPVDEQIIIIDYLEKVCHPIDKDIESAKKLISLLQERKQIIINDVVTGKVKVV